MTTETKDHNSKNQAFAQLEAIVELMDKFGSAQAGTGADYDRAEQAIQENSLSVQVRSGWETPANNLTPSEFEILLCTGGPAVRIVGELDEHSEADNAKIEHQDWGTTWEAIQLTEEQEEKLLAYCAHFYYGVNH